MQIRLLIPIFLFGLCVHGTFLSQCQNVNLKHFSSEDGLPSAMVYEAFQDRQGFMWFATSAGVSRFDGYKFVNYTTEDGLADNEIFGFYQDTSGRIWLRSLNGKISYYFQGQFYNSQNTPSLRGVDKTSLIHEISETYDSSIIIATLSYGFTKYTFKNKIIEFPVPHFCCLNVIQNTDGSYTALASNRLITLYPTGKINKVIYTNCTSERSELINSDFFAGWANALVKINEMGVVEPHTTTEGIILSIYNEGHGFIWLSTTKGVVRYDVTNKKKLSTYLKDEKISSVVLDNENNLWFTTLENGVFLLVNQNIKNYTTADGLSSNKVFSIDSDNEGNLWIGHDNFVLTQIDNKGKLSQKKIINEVPFVLTLDKPHICQITKEGADFFIVGSLATFYLSPYHVTISKSLNGKSTLKWYGDNFVLAGGRNGLRSFSKSLVIKHKEKNDMNGLYNQNHFNLKTISKLRTNCLCRAEEGNVWVGTDNGLMYLKKDTLINFGGQYPILQDRILDIKKDRDGTLFVATDGRGIVILKHKKIIQISQKEGLSSNRCYGIQIDSDFLWIATNNGVNRVTLDKNHKLKSILIIKTTDGVPSNDIHALLVNNNKVWIGTSGGLSVIDKYAKNVNLKTPITYITSIAINNQPIDTARNDFEHEENNLKINFAGLSYKSMMDILYKYRLSRINFSFQQSGPWLDTKNTSVDLSHLPPGNYKFEVKAQNSSGIWGKAAAYPFTIKPPLWNTWWFIILSIASAIVAILYGWKYLQKRRHKKIEDRRTLQLAELKSLRSQTNYHFMSNAFNSLQGLFISENGVDKYIGKFSKLMRFTLENSDRHQIALTEELEYLKIYCDIEQLRVGDGFSFNIAYEEGMKPDHLIVPGLTLQPFIENAIWHGIMPKENIGTINVKIQSNDADSYKIIIEDDGIGINTSLTNKTKSNRKSYGTKLIVDRFEIIKQQSNNKFSVAIEDLYDLTQKNGTRVTIILPYKYDE